MEDKTMSVLHELLAVEGDLERSHKSILDTTKSIFIKNTDLFFAQHRKLEMFVDDDITYPEEYKEMDCTVVEKLEEMENVEKQYYDVILQKECTNQLAVCDLIVDGVTIGTGLPATFLLGMESRLRQLREVYAKIPTLSPGIKWVEDPSQGENIYITEKPAEKLKTETTLEPVVLYEATKEHPAQVKEVSKTNNVGKYISTTWSGMMSPAKKAIILNKIDRLIREVKKARQVANTTTVNERTIGQNIFDYINN